MEGKKIDDCLKQLLDAWCLVIKNTGFGKNISLKDKRNIKEFEKATSYFFSQSLLGVDKYDGKYYDDQGKQKL